MFGLPVPQEITDTKGSPVRYWGCRAIDQGGTLDIVHDRITYNGPEWDKALPLAERQGLPFILWLNRVALPELRAQLPNLPYEQVITVCAEGRQCLVARRAGGYVYVGAWEHHTETCKYDMLHRPEGRWSGTFDPNLGDRVEITINGFGAGTVVSYFCEHGYRGVRVKLDRQPKWHREQGQPPYALVFGAEIREVA
jgi:hypothetical protein